MKHKIQVVMLPTEDKTHLFISHSQGLPAYNERHWVMSTGQHLYITVSQDVEPIKEGDYLIHNNVVVKCLKEEKWLGERKIIATTDSKLLKEHDDSVPIPRMKSTSIAEISQSFLKEYVKNPTGEWEIECGEYCTYCGDEYCDNLRCRGYKDEFGYDTDLEGNFIITPVDEKMYSKKELILISEYVRVGHQSTPKVKTLTLIDEYLRIKENL